MTVNPEMALWVYGGETAPTALTFASLPSSRTPDRRSPRWSGNLFGVNAQADAPAWVQKWIQRGYAEETVTVLKPEISTGHSNVFGSDMAQVAAVRSSRAGLTSGPFTFKPVNPRQTNQQSLLERGDGRPTGATMTLKTLALAHAVSLVKEFEGCRLEAYPDPGSGGDPITIGWGATGPGIRMGVTWTQQQADDRLEADVNRFMDGVLAAVKAPNPTPNEIGALTSFAYNVGLGAFRSSTLLRMYNAGDRKGAAAQLLRWDKAGGKVMRGLTRRRQAEKALFERPKPDFSNVISGANTIPRQE